MGLLLLVGIGSAVAQCAIRTSDFVKANCNNGTGSYLFDLQLTVDFDNPPAGENLRILVDGVLKGVIGAGSVSPSTITLVNLPADGSTGHELVARFETTTTCADTAYIDYAVPCAPDIPRYTGGPGIGGRVFMDFDRDGVEDGVGGWAGVTIIAYDANNSVVDVTFTDQDGDYLLGGVSSGVPYRVEFTTPAVLSELNETSSLTADHRRIQFVTADAEVNLGLSVPSHYTDPEARLFTACYVNGDPTLGGTSGSMDWAVQYPYNAGPTTGLNEYVATGEVLGATWGMAHQRTSDFIYAAPMAKRHSGFGTGGPGTIYRIDMNQVPPVVSEYFNIEDFGFSAGTDPRQPGELTATATDRNRDSSMFDLVGKMAWGDLDMNDRQDKLYLVNLHDKHLYEVSIGLGGFAVGASNIARHPLPDPGCVDGEFRPWAVDYHHGRVYIGGVCSGENGDTTSAKLRAYVYSHDPAQPDGNWTHELDFSLQYGRGTVSGQLNEPAEWRPWVNEWNDLINPLPNTGSYGQTIYPQPILSDIEFDETGAMILGFIDRLGHQGGNENYSPNPGDNATYEIASAGDILRVGYENGAWQLESNGTAAGITSGGATSAGNMGPGGAEFYWGEHYIWSPSSGPDDGGHQETSLGGLAVAKGSGEVALTVYDPASAYRAAGGLWLSNTTGNQNNQYQVFGQDAGGQPATFGKAAGLGDMELRSAPAPFEIGNRVWYDTNRNGRQDAGEPPLPGIRLTIFNQGGDSLASVYTDNEGYYSFTEQVIAASPYTADTILGMAQSYQLVAGIGQFNPGAARLFDTLQLTVPDFQNNERDSDGRIYDTGVGTGYPRTTAYTNEGANTYRYDFGFQLYCPPVITDTVAVCQDNGTPLNGADDYILLTVGATLVNGTATDTFEVVLDALPDGTGGTVLGEAAHGQTVTVGQGQQLPADGTTTTLLTVRKKNDVGCVTTFNAGPLADCRVCGFQCLGPITISRSSD